MASERSPFSVLHLDHLVLIAADPGRLVEFYRRLLGLELERSVEGGLYQLRAGRSLIDIVSADSEFLHASPGRGGLDHFCLRIEPFDADQLRQWLLQHGVSCSEVQRVYGADGYGPAIYFDDPEGNTVELKGPASPGR